MPTRPQKAHAGVSVGSDAQHPSSDTPGAGPSRPRRATRAQRQAEEGPATQTQRSEGADDEQDDGEDWAVNQILDERAADYLLDWTDIDPQTGEQWDPTWEPKSFVSELLVEEWNERKKRDPSIVGVEGQKLKETRKAKELARRKRKREEREATGATKRSRISKSRASTGTPGARDPSAPTTRRSVKREPEPLSEGSRRNGTDADPVVVIDDDDEEDGEEVQAQAPQSSHRRSASTTTPSKQKQIVEVVIDVASPKRSTHQRDSVELPADDEDDQTTADDLMASQQLEGEAYTDDQPPESEDAILPDDEVIDDDLLQAAIADEQDGTDEQPPVADDATPLDQPAQVAELAAAMAPVPVPTATQFRTAVAQTATAATVTEDNSQSTASLGATQLDPIQQFSSPARDPAVRSKGKDKAPTPTRSAEPAPAPASAIVSGPKIVKRFINGEEVMAIESESSDGDRGDTPPQPQPLPPVASVVVVEEEIVQVEVVEQTTTEEPLPAADSIPPAFDPREVPSPVVPAAENHLPAESAAPHADGSNAVEPEPASGPNEIEKLAALMKRLAESASEQQPSDPIRLEDHDLSPAASEIANLLLASQVETKRWRSRAKKAEKSAKRATEDAQQDLAFIREQYTNASNSAVEAVSKSQELEEKVSVLKGQLKYGLKQREVHTAAIKAQHDKEVAQLRAQLQLLLAQSRKTDDRVRAKAAAHDRMRNEVQAKQALIDQLQAVGVDLNMQITDLSNRNNELLGQVELFRARELGVVGPKAAQETDSDASYESSYGSSDDDDDDQSQDAIPTRVLRKSHQEDPLTASQLMPETQDFAPVPNPPTPSAPAALAPAPVDPKPVRAIHKGSTIPSPWAPGIFYADEVAMKQHVMHEVNASFL